MSKYDRLDYLTISEKEYNDYPKCIKNANKENVKIPEELLSISVDDFKKHLHIKNGEEENKFLFAKNNQTKINENYFQNCKILSNAIDEDDKKEFLLDYMSFFFGNIVDGKYFEKNLQDIFQLRKMELTDEEFDRIINDKFGKNPIDLTDYDDREKFKKFIIDNSIYVK